MNTIKKFSTIIFILVAAGGLLLYFSLSSNPDPSSISQDEAYNEVVAASGQERIDVLRELATEGNVMNISDCNMSPRLVHVSSTKDVVFVNDGDRFIYLSLFIPGAEKRLPYFVEPGNDLTVAVGSLLPRPEAPTPVSVACLFIEGDPPFVLEEISEDQRELSGGGYVLVTPTEE